MNGNVYSTLLSALLYIHVNAGQHNFLIVHVLNLLQWVYRLTKYCTVVCIQPILWLGDTSADIVKLHEGIIVGKLPSFLCCWVVSLFECSVYILIRVNEVKPGSCNQYTHHLWTGKTCAIGNKHEGTSSENKHKVL